MSCKRYTASGSVTVLGVVERFYTSFWPSLLSSVESERKTLDNSLVSINRNTYLFQCSLCSLSHYFVSYCNVRFPTKHAFLAKLHVLHQLEPTNQTTLCKSKTHRGQKNDTKARILCSLLFCLMLLESFGSKPLDTANGNLSIIFRERGAILSSVH